MSGGIYWIGIRSLENIRACYDLESHPIDPDQFRFQIFTDASFDPERNLSGWAFVVTDGTQELASEWGQAITKSNNAAEALAFLHALRWCGSHGHNDATIWTDSAYVVEACETWIAIWRTNGWRKIDPNPKNRKRRIADHELWQMIDRELSSHPLIQVVWCKGHVGNIYNEQADRLATMARVRPQQRS